MKFPNVNIKVSYVRFKGGVDQLSPALSIKPGWAANSMNYEPGLIGGYKSIDGFERFSGKSAPSDAVYYYATCTFNGTPAVGDTINGTLSLASGIIARIDGNVLSLTKITGTFNVINEPFNGGGGGTITNFPLLLGYPDGHGDALSRNAAADIYRADIGTVNGARPVRGVWLYKNVAYAFQDNAGGTACEMFKSSFSGWTLVALGEELAFTSGGTFVPTEGATIVGETSGATAVLTRIVLESGTYAAGTAAGRYIFASHTGTFQAETVKIGANLNIANIAGNAAAITLAPLGRYEFVNFNFFASADRLRMYGCDGKNRAFEFDGTVFVPLQTGMPVDKPTHIAAHRYCLWLSFEGSVQYSGLGNPYSWTAITGSAELGLGDKITGFQNHGGDTLAIYTRNTTWRITGTTSSNFLLENVSPEVGAIPYTLQSLGNEAYSLDKRGINELKRVQEFGNFNSATMSRNIQGLINTLIPKAIASSVYRDRNQYRVYGNDGTGIIMTVDKGRLVGIMPFDYNAGRVTNLINPTCACSIESEADSHDVILFGASNGFVYRADKGSSFDGEPKQMFLQMPFNTLNTPLHLKEYLKGVLEMTATGYAEIRFHPEFTYGDPDIQQHEINIVAINGEGGYWDIGTWDVMFYDSRTVNQPEFLINGSGKNMSMIFYSSNDIDRGHSLEGALLQYILRPILR